jgi:hypothetical protein
LDKVQPQRLQWLKDKAPNMKKVKEGLKNTAGKAAEGLKIKA